MSSAGWIAESRLRRLRDISDLFATCFTYDAMFVILNYDVPRSDFCLVSQVYGRAFSRVKSFLMEDIGRRTSCKLPGSTGLL